MPKRDFRRRPTLADRVLLDSSVLINGFDRTAPEHPECSEFLRYVGSEAEAYRTSALTTELAVQECAHAFVKAALVLDLRKGRYRGARERFKRNGGKGFDWNALAKTEPRAVRKHVKKVRDAINDIQAVPVQIIRPATLGREPEDLLQMMTSAMRTYGLMSADAYQVAVARVLNVPMLATCDRDFLRAQSDFTVLINR